MKLDRIYNGDCLEGLKRLPDGCVDLIIADPPYEFVGADANYGGGVPSAAWEGLTTASLTTQDSWVVSRGRR